MGGEGSFKCMGMGFGYGGGGYHSWDRGGWVGRTTWGMGERVGEGLLNGE